MRRGGYEFRPAVVPSLVGGLLFALLMALGFWQLDRAAQKQVIVQAYADRPAVAAIRIDGNFAFGADWRYRRAELIGTYEPEHQFLLDNRVQQGRVGYHVLTPLRLAMSDAVVLINRGWVAQGATRADLPPLPTPAEANLSIQGLIDFPPQNVFVLGEGEDRDPGWPKVLQQIRLDLQAQQLGAHLLPMVLLLDKDQPGGFVRDWNPVVVGPERHIGYAVQWFALAAALLILYVWVNLKRIGVDE